MIDFSLDSDLVNLLDNYAMNSMVALMQIYAPEEWPQNEDEAVEWCDWISTRSYFMATTMMDARKKFYDVLAQVQKEKAEEDNS